MSENIPLNPTARAVIDTSPWFAIATAGPEGPHQAACWTRNIQALDYTDTRIRIPVWRLEQTERNLLADPRIELLFVSSEVRREKGSGQGVSVLGHGEIHRSGPRLEEARQVLDWIDGVLIVTVRSWRFHLP